MSVFDGEIEFKSVYMNDFIKKEKPKSPRRKAVDDDCLIVGLGRDALKPRDKPRKSPDMLCPLKHEYYKEAITRYFPVEAIKNFPISRLAFDRWTEWSNGKQLSICTVTEDYPKIAKQHMTKDIDPVPIENDLQDLNRTEYLVKYCSRELPFMSVNLARRARALQTLRLPDDVEIPDTSQRGSYRRPAPEKYAEHPSKMSMKPKFDDSLTRELRRILRVTTGDTTYDVCHGLLAKVVLNKNPFGPPREEPKYGRWKTPFTYTYYV